MELKRIPLKNILPYPNNPRKNDGEVDAVAESIKQCQYITPIVVDEDMVILAGHTRYKALKKLGRTEAEIIIKEGLTEEQKRKYRLLDNKTNEFAAWDLDLLADELEGLDFDDFDFDWGIDDEEEPEVEEDDYDAEPPAEPKAKRGDIYQLGNHRLMCGDSTDPNDVETLMDGAKADMVFTDPPYGIDVVGANGKVGADNLAKNGVYMPVKGDETTDTTERFFDVCQALGFDRLIIWGGNYFVNFLPYSDGWVIWDKRGDMASNNFADGEMAWCSFHTPVRIYKQVWSGMIREGEHEKRVHPTQKPVRLLGEILKDFTKENEIILDCFGGSGSTLIACEQINRQCYMMEYEPHYIDVIIDRWEKLTGEKAVLL